MADQERPKPPHPGTSKRSIRRGANTRVACLPCQISKVKCDGTRPSCSRCQSKGKTCGYDMEEEERSSRFVRAESKRKAQELGSLWDIVRKLQDENEEEAVAFFRRLRRTENVLGLVAEMKTADTVSPAESGFTSQDMRKSSDEQSALHGIEGEFHDLQFSSAGFLAQKYPQHDSPIISYTPERPALPWSQEDWSDIVADQRGVNELIAQYLTWQHTVFECFPEQHFREDLQAGHGEYHSPLLVHAICATGSLLCEKANAHEESSRHYERALALMQKRPGASLSTIAAMSLLCHIEHGRGRLSSMWLLSGQMMRMIQDIQLHLRKPGSDAQTPRDRTATLRCFWGAFFIDVLVSMSLARLPSIPNSAITLAAPHVDPAQDMREWTNDDFFMKPKPGLRSSTRHHLVTFAQLVNSTLGLFFAPSRQINASAIVTEHKKYLSWYALLPPGLTSISDAPPHVLHLHMQYHSAVLLLYRPFLSAQFVDLPEIHPWQIAMKAAHGISHAFQEHLRQYRHTGVCTLHVHALLTACTIHILNLANQESLESFVLACQSFSILAPRIMWASASLQIIQGLVTRWSIVLPPNAASAVYGQPMQPTFLLTGMNQTSSYLTHGGSLQNDNSSRTRGRPDLAPFPNQPSPLLDLSSYHQSDGISSSAQSMSEQAGLGPSVSGIEWGDEGWMTNLLSDPTDID